MHPGSPETLLAIAGQNATLQFEEMSHSKHAMELMEQFVVWKPCGYLLERGYIGGCGRDETSSNGLWLLVIVVMMILSNYYAQTGYEVMAQWINIGCSMK